MKSTSNLSYVDFELYKNETTWFSLSAFYVGYGFKLKIIDLNTEETVFSKFLKTQDIDYCGNYLRKVVKNNFGATIA